MRISSVPVESYGDTVESRSIRTRLTLVVLSSQIGTTRMGHGNSECSSRVCSKTRGGQTCARVTQLLPATLVTRKTRPGQPTKLILNRFFFKRKLYWSQWRINTSRPSPAHNTFKNTIWIVRTRYYSHSLTLVIIWTTRLYSQSVYRISKNIQSVAMIPENLMKIKLSDCCGARLSIRVSVMKISQVVRSII